LIIGKRRGRQFNFMKKIIVEIEDDSKAELVESISVNHLSDLGESVKDVVEDFVMMNEGVVLPPVSIQVKEQKTDSQA